MRPVLRLAATEIPRKRCWLWYIGAGARRTRQTVATWARVVFAFIVIFGRLLGLFDYGGIPNRTLTFALSGSDESHLSICDLDDAAISQVRLHSAL
ncbi:hypothetical protein KC329_g27 [Hortaea werneckii]|nr:hypothetical protein KC329_g27 [Hortaea werneckii]